MGHGLRMAPEQVHSRREALWRGSRQTSNGGSNIHDPSCDHRSDQKEATQRERIPMRPPYPTRLGCGVSASSVCAPRRVNVSRDARSWWSPCDLHLRDLPRPYLDNGRCSKAQSDGLLE